jgi:DNA-binding FadR family transcriptional regulator
MSSAPGKSAAGKLATIAPLPQPRSLAHELIARLAADITGGRIPPGARLPTEQELIAATGVSRTVVREAVAALRAEGLVVTRQGVGAFVPANARRPFRVDVDRLSSLREVLDVMELRTGVETEAAGLAAERGSPAQVRSIADRLAAVDDALRRGEDAIDQDFAFHCSIADATGNPQFRRLLEHLGRLIIPRQTIQGGPGIPRRLYSETFQKEHRDIVQAIRAGAVAPARAAMRRHLLSSRKRYQKFAAQTGKE